MPTLVSINISPGGIPKVPVPQCQVSISGLEGDGQQHTKHRKPARAVSLLDIEIVQQLSSEGYPVDAGSLGENLTMKGFSAGTLVVGSRLQFGSGVVLELTEPRKPCFVLDAIHPALKDVTVGRLGWLAQVITPGLLIAGQEITILSPMKG
ncbi:MAG: MOSC domain-containing protein [Sedimentisphaerales bacterium]|nr:MOSC domain-containing protein [Sedimentisphaerales bacterium]